MIRKKKECREIVIDLTGPEGNVFVLMGYARKLSRHVEDLYREELEGGIQANKIMLDLGLIGEKIFPNNLAERIIGEMMSSNYENAVKVFDRYFGSFVILER